MVLRVTDVLSTAGAGEGGRGQSGRGWVWCYERLMCCPLQELCEDLEEVCADPHGSRVLLYLLNPRSPRHFKKSFCAILEGGDGNKYR